MVRAPAGAVSCPLVPARGSETTEGQQEASEWDGGVESPDARRTCEVGAGSWPLPTSSPALPTKKCLPAPNGDKPTCRCSSENHNC